MAAPLLNISALSRRTGVAPDTLRKWELRYRVLRPERTAGGQRRYGEGDVQRVEWLRDRIEEGWRIGEAARILDEAGPPPLANPAALREAMITAIRDNEPHSLSALLDQAFAVLPVEQAFGEVIAPVLGWVGDAWHAGEASIAQEHLLTGKVRAHLGGLASEGRGSVRGSAVLACAPGEQHEIGLMMLAVALRADGWRVEFLGADTPVESALAFAHDTGAIVTCISATRTDALEHVRTSLAETPVPAGMTIVLGGSAVTPEIARELGATFAAADLGEAVAKLRVLASA